MAIRSEKERFGWAQFDALQLGSGWDEEDIGKPQILVEDAYGDSHPGSVHLAGLSTQAVYGVYEKGGHPAQFHVTDICDGCAQGHDGMNLVLASREVIADMIEMHAGFVPWDGMLLSSSCDKSIPAHLKAAARVNIPAIFIPGGSMRPGPNQTTSLVAGDISLRQKRKNEITPAVLQPARVPSWGRRAPCSAWRRRWGLRCPAAHWRRPPCGISFPWQEGRGGKLWSLWKKISGRIKY